MTKLEYYARLAYRLEQRARGRTFTPESLEAQLPDALNLLCQRVYDSPKRAALEKSYNLSLVSGAVDLSTNTFSDLWFSSIPTAYLLYPNGDGTFIEVDWYENPRDLDMPGFVGLYRYSLLGNNIIVRDEAGNAPVNATMTMRASFIPLISDLASHGSLDSDLLDIGVEIALRVPRGTEIVAGAEVK